KYQTVNCNRVYNNYINPKIALLVEIKNLLFLLIIILISLILNILTLIKRKFMKENLKKLKIKSNIELSTTLYIIINFMGMFLIFINNVIAIIGEILVFDELKVLSIQLFPFLFDIATLLYTPIFVTFR
uniref:Serpentine receptor class gamma n=1 Tax=Strongyloides stercoralis TaxID=6248 RepID=A0AAF5D0J0_STRER